MAGVESLVSGILMLQTGASLLGHTNSKDRYALDMAYVIKRHIGFAAGGNLLILLLFQE